MRPRTPRSTLFPYTTLFRSTIHDTFGWFHIEAEARMKKWLPLILTACMAAWFVSTLRPAKSKDFHYAEFGDRKSTRLNSSHQIISYAVFCLKKKKEEQHTIN